jgi:hypothetical protein
VPARARRPLGSPASGDDGLLERWKTQLAAEFGDLLLESPDASRQFSDRVIVFHPSILGSGGAIVSVRETSSIRSTNLVAVGTYWSDAQAGSSCW